MSEKVVLEPSSDEDLNIDEENGASWCDVVVDIESEDEDITSKPFVPIIKINKMDDSILIETIVLKDVALTSDFFRVLEEEQLDIVFENQYRTETKVAHTVQVKVQQGYNTDALEKKLCIWAGKPHNTTTYKPRVFAYVTPLNVL